LLITPIEIKKRWSSCCSVRCGVGLDTFKLTKHCVIFYADRHVEDKGISFGKRSRGYKVGAGFYERPGTIKQEAYQSGANSLQEQKNSD
jgi:hypothetical protein